MKSYYLISTESQFCRMKMFWSWMAHRTFYIPTNQQGDTLRPQAIGLLIFIQSKRSRDIWDLNCIDQGHCGRRRHKVRQP